MTTRELWQNIMHYGQFDRMPVMHWNTWDETRERWAKEGMPLECDARQFLSAVPHWVGIEVNVTLFPMFEEEVLEETEEYRIFRDSAGVIKKDWKHRSCIPQHTDWTLKEAKAGTPTPPSSHQR